MIQFKPSTTLFSLVTVVHLSVGSLPVSNYKYLLNLSWLGIQQKDSPSPKISSKPSNRTQEFDKEIQLERTLLEICGVRDYTALLNILQRMANAERIVSNKDNLSEIELKSLEKIKIPLADDSCQEFFAMGIYELLEGNQAEGREVTKFLLECLLQPGNFDCNSFNKFPPRTKNWIVAFIATFYYLQSEGLPGHSSTRGLITIYNKLNTLQTASEIVKAMMSPYDLRTWLNNVLECQPNLRDSSLNGTV